MPSLPSALSCLRRETGFILSVGSEVSIILYKMQMQTGYGRLLWKSHQLHQLLFFLVSFGWVGSLKENIRGTIIAFNSKFWRLSQCLCCDKFKHFILSSVTFVFTFNVLVCCCQAGFNGMLTFLKSLSRDLSKSHIWDDLGNLCAITSPE